jgi:hypothetical protein
MNSVRKSFIHQLLTDPIIKELTNLHELTTFFNQVYIEGSKTKFTTTEQKVIDSKYNFR